MNDEIKNYRDLKVWQQSMDLVVECYKMVRGIPGSEKYGLASQLQRAAVSVPANIAEGHGRAYTKEYLRHLSVAKGSLTELETHIQIATRLSYCNQEQQDSLLKTTDFVGRMLTGLQKSLKAKLRTNSNSPSPTPHAQ